MQLRTWDRLKLAEFFTPIDIESILKIPLCTRQQEDFWAWHFDSKGVFSVRSAYRMLVTYKEHATAFFEHSASGSDTRAEQKEWLGFGSWRSLQRSEFSCGGYSDTLCLRVMSDTGETWQHKVHALSVAPKTPGSMHYLSATWPAACGLWRTQK